MSGWVIALIIFGIVFLIPLIMYIAVLRDKKTESNQAIENYKNKIQEFKINTVKVDNNFNEVKELELVKKVEDSLIKKDTVKVNTLNLLIYSKKVLNVKLLSNKQSHVNGNSSGYNSYAGLFSSRYNQGISLGGSLGSSHINMNYDFNIQEGNENLGDNDFNFIKSLLGDQYSQLLFKRDWYVVSVDELPENYEDILKRKKDGAISKINTMSKEGKLSLTACEKIYSGLENSIASIIENKQYYYHKPTGLILEVNYDL